MDNSNNNNKEDSNSFIVDEIVLERSLLKTPIESLSQSFRVSQRNIEREMTILLNTINDMNKKKDTIPKEEVVVTIDKLIQRMNNLKRKVEESKVNDDNQIKRLKSRIDHIKEYSVKQNDTFARERFNNLRVARVLIDHLLRDGQYDTTIQLANKLKINDLVDIDIFTSSKKVIVGLEKHEFTDALQWCQENKSKLSKLNSTLEFNLRIQEFIELVRLDKFTQAIQYAKIHLSPHASTNMKEIQRAMGTLVMGKKSSFEHYNSLFDKSRWTDLINQFKSENYNIHCLTSKSLLSLFLQSGLSVLKTESCNDEESKNINCPVCDENFNSLAKPLPISLQSHSCLICRITGEVMNEDNPPYVLPNGQAYSRNAMIKMAEENDGLITCPKTGLMFDIIQLRKAYIS